MAGELSTLDLAALGLAGGQVRSFEAQLAIDPLRFGGETYTVEPDPFAATVEVGRMVGPGFELKLRFEATLVGPCVRCLKEAHVHLLVAAHELHSPGAGEELDSPYVTGGLLDVRAWARDAFVLSLPTKILCDPGCKGLCPVCAADLNLVEAGHHHDPPTDPRLAPLAELWQQLGEGRL
jgi:uncharacterized protein